METYTEIKKRHSDEFGAFPIQFAFSDKQLKEALEKLGAELKDCMTIGAGSILRKSDYDGLKALQKRHSDEMKQFKADDKSLIAAIVYELGNHEFCITYDPTDTINALGLDMSNERVAGCFKKARAKYAELQKEINV